jgi:glycosyltransferase involved in cell wall biosynthesis
MPPRLLIITRNYPPQTGGLENYSFHLIRELKRRLPLRVLALSRDKRHLVWFLPFALAAGLACVRLGAVPWVHLCDGLLAPLGLLLKAFCRCRVSATVHGLDVTFAHPLYARLVPACLKRLDRIVCVSRSTRDECLKRGVAAERCVVIPNGIRPEEIYLAGDRGDLMRTVETGLGRSFAGKRVLVTVGRLVKRKGVQWFVEQVLPRLGADYAYIVVGTGPEFGGIQETVRRCNLQDRVILTGRQPDHFRNCLLNAAEAFIMPNICVPGDVEGFGIAALEAGACGLPVIAAGIQGIRDAVIDGVTGRLVAERDVDGFVASIRSLNLDRRRIRQVVAETYSWEKIGRAYAELLSAGEAVITQKA